VERQLVEVGAQEREHALVVARQPAALVGDADVELLTQCEHGVSQSGFRFD
jgi:hypothetical protein